MPLWSGSQGNSSLVGFLLPFLQISDTLANFQALGLDFCWIKLLYMVISSVISSSLGSLYTLEWILSGVADFVVLVLWSFFLTIFSVITKFPILCEICYLPQWHWSTSGNNPTKSLHHHCCHVWPGNPEAHKN